MSTAFPRVLEWYEVNGVQFASPSFMISSVTKGLAGRKGSNVGAASLHGELFREKRLSPRTETWSIWVTDADPTTGESPEGDDNQRSQFNANIDTVLNVLSEMPDLLTIVHHRISPDDAEEYEPRVAYGEVVSQISIPDHHDLYVAQFDVEVAFPDPRWHSPNLIASPLTAAYSGSDVPVTCLAADVGTAPVTYMTITFTSTSSLTNPELWNDTYDHTYTGIGYDGTIPSGQSVVIDTNTMTLKKNNVNDISKLLRFGNRQPWFELFPTDNTLTFSAASGGGTVEISYRKAYY